MDSLIIKEKISEKLSDFPLNTYAFFDPKIINFSEEVRGMCAQNSCGKFGTNWQCPPAVGSVDENRLICQRFNNALILNTVAELEDSFDFEGMMEAGANHKKTALQIKDFMKSLTDDFLMFGAGGCNLCPRCSYLDGEPCRKPDETMPAMEACGIFVVELCKTTGLKYINGQDTVTYFSLILF